MVNAGQIVDVTTTKVVTLNKQLLDLVQEKQRLETNLAAEMNIKDVYLVTQEAYRAYIKSTDWWQAEVAKWGLAGATLQLPQLWMQAKQQNASNIQNINNQIQAQDVKINAKQKELDAARQELQSDKDASQTPEQKAADQQKLFAQKSTQYLIIAAIGIVLIAVTVLIFKKIKQS